MFLLKKTKWTKKNNFLHQLPKKISVDDVFFVCIGTDRSTGDSLGPLVGTMLEDLNYPNVLGTIDHPLHAVNMEERLSTIPVNKVIIAIDAALGDNDSIGKVIFHKGGIKPGSAVGKDLPMVGDYSLKGIVNRGGYMEFVVLQNTRLKVVKDLSMNIVGAIAHRFPLEEKEEKKVWKDKFANLLVTN